MTLIEQNNEDTKRFLQRVDFNGPISDKAEGRCWIWTGKRTTLKGRKTYGRFWFLGRDLLAHRVMMGLPKELVLHRCDNPPCVNPNHLFLGSYKDNYEDARAKGRNTRGEMVANSKLTEDQVREIKQKREETGLYYYLIAKEYGVSSVTVWRICTGLGWKHIE